MAKCQPRRKQLAQRFARGHCRMARCLQVSPACQTHVKEFLTASSHDPSHTSSASDTAVFAVCSRDAMSTCEWKNLAYQDPPGSFPRHVIACLRGNKAHLSPECQEQLLKQQIAAANDVAQDQPLHDACQLDISRLCSSTSEGAASTLQCLQQHAQQVWCTPVWGHCRRACDPAS